MEEVAVDKKYLDYIDNFIEQITPLLPKDVNKLQQSYLVSNIKYSTILLASSMETDPIFKSLVFERQCLFIRIMGEWSFHKEIDLFRSGIPAKHWRNVMQKIWYTVWEVMYACIQNSAPDDVLLSIIERYVNRTYNYAIEDLKQSNIIDEAIEEKAKEQSNIEIMAQEYREKIQKRKNKKIIYYALLFVLISVLVSVSVIYFKIYGVIGILVAMIIYNIFMYERKR
ncbi:hypothetical protein IJ596_01030 [bacterium]|nr:hypothetical protein [bacterium]